MYLDRYPRGLHAYDARRRLALLTAPPAPPPGFATIVYDVPPPPPEEIVYIERPYLVFGDPMFGFAPPPPQPVYFLPPPPACIASPPNNVIFANIHNTTVVNNVINRPGPIAPAQGPGTAGDGPSDAFAANGGPTAHGLLWATGARR